MVFQGADVPRNTKNRRDNIYIDRILLADDEPNHSKSLED
jgi:hypothetical protein